MYIHSVMSPPTGCIQSRRLPSQEAVKLPTYQVISAAPLGCAIAIAVSPSLSNLLWPLPSGNTQQHGRGEC